MSVYTAPDFTRSALITIDTQNDFTLQGAPVSIPGTIDVIPNMVKLLDHYRGAGRPIIHVVRLYLEDGSNVELCRRQAVENGQEMVLAGSDGAELVRELKPDANVRLDAGSLLSGEFQQLGDVEFVMYKPRWGAFYQTRLEEFLSGHGIDTLVFCGCNFPNCPRTSMYEASERDFRLVVVTDAISQLYDRGRREMENIGANLFETGDIMHT